MRSSSRKNPGLADRFPHSAIAASRVVPCIMKASRCLCSQANERVRVRSCAEPRNLISTEAAQCNPTIDTTLAAAVAAPRSGRKAAAGAAGTAAAASSCNSSSSSGSSCSSSYLVKKKTERLKSRLLKRVASIFMMLGVTLGPVPTCYFGPRIKNGDLYL